MSMKYIFDRKIEEVFLVTSLLIMVILMFTQSISRYAFGNSFSWGSELAQYLHVWQIWIGASLAVRMQSHIKVDVFINLLPKKIKKYIDILGILAWFVFALFLAYEGTKYVIDVQASGQTSPSLKISMWIPYLAIPIGGALMCLRLIQQIYLIMTNKLVEKKQLGEEKL
ncbi:MAG TPA: TRAP transporter small permease [Pseudogracilibacillus sp.]|nr:TRAP transporter small permease [Pseudogracilibacillus sp.]